MRQASFKYGISGLALSVAMVAACAGPSASADGPPAPTDTETPPVASSAPPVATATATTAAPVTSSAPGMTAEPVTSAAPVMTAAPTASAPALPEPAGANLHVGSMAVDGMTVEDLACHADGLGLLGSMLVVGGISKKKAALEACAPKGDRPRVEWTAAKGVVGKVKVKASTPAIEACVTKALNGTKAPFEGECAATLVLGKK
jgi:hypothetical protein